MCEVFDKFIITKKLDFNFFGDNMDFWSTYILKGWKPKYLNNIIDDVFSNWPGLLDTNKFIY